MRLYQGIGFLTNTFKTTKEMRWFSFKGQTPLYSWDSRQISPGMSSNAVLNVFMMLSVLFAEAAHGILAFLNVLVKLHLLVCFVKLLSILWVRDSGKNQKQDSSEGSKLKKVWTCTVSASSSSIFSHCLVVWESSEALFSHPHHCLSVQWLLKCANGGRFLRAGNACVLLEYIKVKILIQAQC